MMKGLATVAEKDTAPRPGVSYNYLCGLGRGPAFTRKGQNLDELQYKFKFWRELEAASGEFFFWTYFRLRIPQAPNS